ncbi:zinc ribbon domain-containing protein [Lachnospiraceae bacterium LCP25S3_G4]
MKEFFEDLGKKITETAETVGKKTEEMVEIQRIRSQIRTMERNNDRDWVDLGKMIYERFKDGAVIDGEYLELCQEIGKRVDSITEFEKQIADLKGMGNCEKCHARVSKDMVYCPNCGARTYEEDQDMKVTTPVSEEVIICPQTVSQTEEVITEEISENTEKGE